MRNSTSNANDTQSFTSKSANKLGVKMETQITLLEGELTRYMTQLEEAGLENAKLRQTIKMLQDDLLEKIYLAENQGIEKIEYEKKLRFIEGDLMKMAQEKQACEKQIKELKTEKDNLLKQTKALQTVILDLKSQMEINYGEPQGNNRHDNKKSRGRTNKSLDHTDLFRPIDEEFMIEPPKLTHPQSLRSERMSFAKNKNRKTFAMNDKEKIENAVKLIGVPGAIIEEQKNNGMGTLSFEDRKYNRRVSVNKKPAKPTVYFKPQHLFEDFIICGIPPQSEDSDINRLFGASGIEVPGRVLWNFAGKEKLADGPRKEIHDFLYPFGVNIHDCTEDSEHIEQLTHRVILKEKSYRKRLVLPLLAGREDLNVMDWDPEVETLNPNHLVYFMGIQFKDFVAIQDPDDPEKATIVEASAIACFMTYYPISPLFIHLVKMIISQFRMMRKRNYLTNGQNYKKCDLWSSLPEFIQLITPHLQEIQRVLDKDFGYSKRLEIRIDTEFDKPITGMFFLPSADQASSCESLWNSFLVITNLNLEDIKWLFSALLLEKKLVFISKNITFLTAVLSFMICMIKPFRYTYPMIFNLPEMLISLIDAPGAALIGINRTEDYFWEEDLLDLYPTCTFVFLDEKKIYSLDSETEVGKMPVFQEFDEKLETNWEKIQNDEPPSQMKKCFTMSNIKKVKFKNCGSIIGVDWEKHQKIQGDNRHLYSQLIFQTFKQSIEEKMIKPLLNYKFGDNEEGDFEKVCQQIISQYMMYSKNRAFLKELVQSQFFIFYYETTLSKSKAKKLRYE